MINYCVIDKCSEVTNITKETDGSRRVLKEGRGGISYSREYAPLLLSSGGKASDIMYSV